jgi:hypothetical protein
VRVSLRGLDNCSGHLPAVAWANIEQPSVWAKDENIRQKVEKQAPDTFRSNEEPRRGLDPLRIDLIEDRFEGLKGKKLVKEREDCPTQGGHNWLKGERIQVHFMTAG